MEDLIVTSISQKVSFRDGTSYHLLKTASLVFMGALLLAGLSQVSIPMYPVPITLQTFGVLLLGITLSPMNAFYAGLAYLAAASAGLPVLSGGHINPLWILEPAAGYLASFPFAAYLTSLFVKKSYLLSGIVAGQMLTFVVGIAYLSALIGFEAAFWTGFVVFIPGTLLKSAAAYCYGRFTK